MPPGTWLGFVSQPVLYGLCKLDLPTHRGRVCLGECKRLLDWDRSQLEEMSSLVQEVGGIQEGTDGLSIALCFVGWH